MTSLDFTFSFRADRFQYYELQVFFRSVQLLHQFLISWEHFTHTLTKLDHPQTLLYFLQPVHSFKI